MINDLHNHEVTAFYENRLQAQQAVQRLNEAAIPAADVRIVEGNDPATNAGSRTDEDKGFFDMLSDFFMPDEERHVYAEGLHRGGYVVSARVSAENHERVVKLLDDDYSVDLDQRAEQWRGEGWTGYQKPSEAQSSGADETIEVAAERLKVGKRDVSHGRVKVRSYVVEDDVSEDVALTSKTVDVERNAVDRVVDNADAAFRERTIEVEETAEEAVVAKEARIVEEIDVSRDVETKSKTVRDTVRHTEVEIEDERH